MTNAKPKVSVIVPIYNVETFIGRCAVSLFEQTLDDMEFIFVNDATPDNSISILKDIIKTYPNRHGQIKIINHETNQGAAISRKDGIEAATGEYIIHCDSDDWVDRDMYRTMYEKAREERSDIVICDWYETDGTHHAPIQQNLDVNTDLLKGLLRRSISGSLCNKLIACYIYRNLTTFPTAHMMEDVAYSVQFALSTQNRVSYLSKPLYYYYHNPNSICHKPNESSCLARCEQACENINYIIELLKEHEIENKYRNELVILKNSARVFLWSLYMSQPSKYYYKWRSIYPEINRRYPLTSGISCQLRFIFFLASIKIYPYILKAINRLRRSSL